MPKMAENIIQTRAPGPPRWRAVATPAMFPVPTVAASAVAIAANEEIVPAPSFFFLIFPSTSRNIRAK